MFRRRGRRVLRTQDVYLSDFSVDGRHPAQENGVLHEILDAGALDLLLDVSAGLLPGSEVNLRDVSGHGPEKSRSVTTDTRREPDRRR